MREIKFRAWDKEEEKMLIVAEIDFHQKHLWGVWYESETRQGNYKLLLDNAILMQYTGLKDKNEKEIYEGDIVIPHKAPYKIDEPCEIIYFGAGFTPKGWGTSGLMYDYDWEVIGNIYENGELLTLPKDEVRE
jgi:hypothetical protein